jgi:hypothetical protein
MAQQFRRPPAGEFGRWLTICAHTVTWLKCTYACQCGLGVLGQCVQQGMHSQHHCHPAGPQ